MKATVSPGVRRRAQDVRVHGDVAVPSGGGAWESVYVLVRAIPPGRVMTYGQIAALLGNVLSPKAVGWAMHACPDDVPWQRVVNAIGRCATDRRGDMPPGLQRSLLEREGVEFRLDGTLDLARWRHEPLVRRVRVRR
ncbi:MAG TPA: MGMT family protein [Candidatus Kryptobacter bacterium]|nr:MAG: hypothetical protein B7Z68_06385 [Acidobacteria bacterium 21-70-11]OYW01054.1 MAG: hypothetical protein B7Z61_12835 [Acidobacteria bacterium 37-71-11]HQT90438.1 MGMT family protein [Candidatus Kryptobacter bacterium]